MLCIILKLLIGSEQIMSINLDGLLQYLNCLDKCNASSHLSLTALLLNVMYIEKEYLTIMQFKTKQKSIALEKQIPLALSATCRGCVF